MLVPQPSCMIYSSSYFDSQSHVIFEVFYFKWPQTARKKHSYTATALTDLAHSALLKLGNSRSKQIKGRPFIFHNPSQSPPSRTLSSVVFYFLTELSTTIFTFSQQRKEDGEWESSKESKYLPVKSLLFPSWKKISFAHPSVHPTKPHKQQPASLPSSGHHHPSINAHIHTHFVLLFPRHESLVFCWFCLMLDINSNKKQPLLQQFVSPPTQNNAAFNRCYSS